MSKSDLPFKPVSSLRSHFEALKAVAPSKDCPPISRESSPKTPHPTNVPFPAAARASLDAPRPQWLAVQANGQNAEATIRTKGSAEYLGQSPVPSKHKRPISVDLQSSSRLPPAVTINSPRSPSPTKESPRSGSRSPEHQLRSTITDKFGKSRTSVSIPSSPSGRFNFIPNLEPRSQDASGSTNNTPSSLLPARTSSIPPPINRAEKPKLPPKPTTQARGLSLTPEPVESHDRRRSPFSTPPSSEGSVSPESQIFGRDLTPSEAVVKEGAKHNPVNFPIVQSQTLGDSEPEQSYTTRSRGATETAKPGQSWSLDRHSYISPQQNLEVRMNRVKTVSEYPSSNPSVPYRASERPSPNPRSSSRYVSDQKRSMSSISVLLPPAPGAEDSISKAASSLESGAMRDKPVSIHKNAPVPPARSSEARPLQRSDGAPPQPPRPFNRHTKPNPATKDAMLRNEHTTANASFPRRSTIGEGREPIQPPLDEGGSSILPTDNVFQQNQEDFSVVDATEANLRASQTEYPDSTRSNRRPPCFHQGAQEIPTKFDSRVFDICGRFAVTTGYTTRAWDLVSGEQIMSLGHGETVKMTCIAFKPGQDLDEEGTRIWIGNNIGEIHEIDISSQAVVSTTAAHNRREILRILRQKKNVWTLDDEGKLFVWRGDESRLPSLKSWHHAHRVPKGYTFALAVGDELWFAAGKYVHVFRPGHDSSFNVLPRPLAQSGTGDITCGASRGLDEVAVYFGHADGRITIYSAQNHTCTGTVKASDYKISAMSFVGTDLWTAYKTGKVYIYDTSCMPWKVKKDWRAHESPILSLLVDQNSVFALDRLQVASLGHDNFIRFWDGMLGEDWEEEAMQAKDSKYCSFREIGAAVVTWNVGACNPLDIREDFLADAIPIEDPPEILVFGFQEIVDLEDRAVTAKSILGFGKRKDKENARSEQHVSRVYRQWRDYLGRCINRYVGAGHTYVEVHTSCLIGLLQCVFVLQKAQGRLTNLSSTDVKCGMKGRYGNKGALVTRFMLDDSSICLINCHLAAGQTQTSHRNNDVASILEASSLPIERDKGRRTSHYVGGGDGTQILDHEICILNGDLNYRIDTIPRDTVVRMIEQGELQKLFERDQITICRRKLSGFRLGVFAEAPINFAPTYKYDVGTDRYDSSEKKRAPAWCDRLLYRGAGRIKQTEYRRHEVRVSDHRPVSGVFRMRVKTIHPDEQDVVRAECQRELDKMRQKMAVEAGTEYLIANMGLPEKEARNVVAPDSR